MGIAERQKKFSLNSRSRLTGPLKTSSDIRKSPEWKKIRELVLNRDNYTCCRCGASDDPNYPSAVQLTVDHIVPVSSGGLNMMNNLETLCAVCHSKKIGSKNKKAAHLLTNMQSRKTKKFR
jgi:5-methylcytosine-specific restriction endonuclease McrA